MVIPLIPCSKILHLGTSIQKNKLLSFLFLFKLAFHEITSLYKLQRLTVELYAHDCKLSEQGKTTTNIVVFCNTYVIHTCNKSLCIGVLRRKYSLSIWCWSTRPDSKSKSPISTKWSYIIRGQSSSSGLLRRGLLLLEYPSVIGS